MKSSDLRVVASGKAVSKHISDKSRQAYAGSHLEKWNICLKDARVALGFEGRFVSVGGPTEEGRLLHETTKAIMQVRFPEGAPP